MTMIENWIYDIILIPIEIEILIQSGKSKFTNHEHFFGGMKKRWRDIPKDAKIYNKHTHTTNFKTKMIYSVHVCASMKSSKLNSI